MSHTINVTVKGCPPPQFTFGPCDYRMIALVMFVIVVAMLCVASTQRCKGVCRAGEPGNAPDPSGQPSRGSSRTRHIYENDPPVP
ncbi:hypothetical protein INR49_000961 [Caranx melampygus]|nr:hypothetical protein INR49_000961 [Caranx melampygus]